MDGYRLIRAPGVLIGAVAAALVASSVMARDLPDYDAAAHSGSTARAPFTPGDADRAKIKPGTTVRTDERLGVPTFLWAAPRAAHGPLAPSLAGLPPEQAARRHLAEYASVYGLQPEELRDAVLDSVHDTGQGAIIVTFHRAVYGIEVFRDATRLVMDRDRELVAISGFLPGRAHVKGPIRSPVFTIDAPQAIALAYENLAGTALDARDLEKAAQSAGGYETWDLGPLARDAYEVPLLQPARARKTLFRLPDRLEPAWYVELDLGPKTATDSDYYACVVSAKDGALLFRKNLTVSDSYTYRVWADTTGLRAPYDGPQGTAPTPLPSGLQDGYQAPFVGSSLVTLQNGPISTNDPWLPPAATQTNGNNADAYADLASPDGLSGSDFRATTTGGNVFDRTFDTGLQPTASTNQQMAVVTQLFYDVNFLHDWFYGSGFDEAAGNAQTSNYGRGGIGNDNLRAEAQDYSGRNNANMSTPSDGGRPRMQMYIFDGIGERSLTVNSPASITGTYAVGTATFGPASFNRTNTLVLVNDGAGTTSDGCESPWTNAAAVSGKIAFIDRGNCNFNVKVANAQLNGAVGAIIANNAGTGILNMTGTDSSIFLPSLLISQADGNAIRAQFGAGVNATLYRAAAIDRDGGLDNQIVAHEWGHYLSNRLIGNATGLSNNQGNGMGEGWADFVALLLTVRPEDAMVPSNANFAGVYPVAGYVRSGGPNGPVPNYGYYFGIRRVPYSTDFSKNPLTFRHIANGNPLPGTAPIAFGADGSNNAEVHNTGEVWATMLWECYASLLRDTGRLTFDQARDRMRAYLVASLKLTPNAPTILEARDAVLAAAYANDQTDFMACAQAFARRGAGLRAVAPDRGSTTNQGVVESFVAGSDLEFVAASLDDDVAWCDRDGSLDVNETGRLTVTLRNVGTGALSATTATVTSTNPAVSFPGGGQITFPPSQPYGMTTGSVNARLGSATGIQPIEFSIAFTDPGLAIPGTVTASSMRLGNFDDLPDQSATDDVESATTAWTVDDNPFLDRSGPWRRIELSGLDHRWLGPDPGAQSDQYLISPPLQVAPAGSFSFSFRHRYSFENSGGLNYDGGVIEISTTDGEIWTDIGSHASPGYPGGNIDTCCGNPLGGRAGFVRTSAGYPAFANVTVNLGTAYNGQTVLVRFRIGADEAIGGPGWEIDDLVFNNILNTPFHILVPDRGLCLDSDSDGFDDLADCAPLDGTAWALPTEARDLMLAGAPATTLAWLAPGSPGGTALRYDLLRSMQASSFGAAACVASDALGLTASDPALPADVFFYLVRSENACGGTLGSDSAGAPRSGAGCP